MSPLASTSTELNSGPLTHDIVVDKAIELLNAEGAEALSMRRIADALGVKAPALYRHIGSKNEMTDAILQRVMDEFRYESDVDATWDDATRTLMRAVREHLLHYPWVVDLTKGEHALGLYRLRDDALALLTEAGLSDADLYRHYRLMLWAVLGFTATELGTTRRGTHKPRADVDSAGSESLPRGERQFTVTHPSGDRLPAPYDVVDLDVLFDTAVEHFIGGVRSYARGNRD